MVKPPKGAVMTNPLQILIDLESLSQDINDTQELINEARSMNIPDPVFQKHLELSQIRLDADRLFVSTMRACISNHPE